MSEANPYPKSTQLSRGTERRSFRKRADAKEMARLRTAKMEPCRVCKAMASNGGFRYQPQRLELHHVVPRSMGGDDTEDNLVMLCVPHHAAMHAGDSHVRAALAASLTDAEYAYTIDKLGEGALERLFGVGSER